MPVRKWDSGLVVRTIRKYHREGRDVSYNAMARTQQDLVSAANYYHGTYREAVRLAGIDYSQIRRKPCWSSERIIKVIRKAHRQGIELQWSKVSVRRDEFGWAAKAAIRQWGGWPAALKAAGLDPDRIGRYRRWDEKAIVAELRARARRGQPINSGVIQAELAGLYGAAVRRFGSYDAAMAKAGVNPKDIVQRRQWTPDLVCEHLREFELKVGVVSQATLRSYDTGLLRAIRLFFDDLPSAIQAAKVRKFSVRGHPDRSRPTAKPRGIWRDRKSPAKAKA